MVRRCYIGGHCHEDGLITLLQPKQCVSCPIDVVCVFGGHYSKRVKDAATHHSVYFNKGVCPCRASMYAWYSVERNTLIWSSSSENPQANTGAPCTLPCVLPEIFLHRAAHPKQDSRTSLFAEPDPYMACMRCCTCKAEALKNMIQQQSYHPYKSV